FALDLHRKLGSGNLFFSPLSVSTALSMTCAGARGATAADMAKALRHPFAGERLHKRYAGLLGKLSGDQAGVRLNIANALGGPYEYQGESVYLNRDSYAPPVRRIALVGAEPVINRWVEERPAGRIRELIPPRTFDQFTRLVLTNAVYFKGTWQA